MVIDAAFPALKRTLILSPMLAASLVAGGCMSSPTYGTDKTANEQLIDDLSGMMSFGGTREAAIDYKPRPELVKPASTAALPAPQENVASAENGVWPESPEQRRARIRADATANQDNPNYRAEVVPDIAPGTRPATPVAFGRENERPLNGTEPNARQKRTEFNRRLTEQRQGDEANRKFLSEPPIDYRQPAQTAAVGDVGEDEAIKERRAKSAARSASGKTGVQRWVPWL